MSVSEKHRLTAERNHNLGKDKRWQALELPHSHIYKALADEGLSELDPFMMEEKKND